MPGRTNFQFLLSARFPCILSMCINPCTGEGEGESYCSWSLCVCLSVSSVSMAAVIFKPGEQQR